MPANTANIWVDELFWVDGERLKNPEETDMQNYF